MTQHRTDTIEVHYNSTDGEFVLNNVPYDLVMLVADDSAVVTTAPNGMVTLAPKLPPASQLPGEVAQLLRSQVQVVAAKNLLISYGSVDDAVWAVGMMLGHSTSMTRTMAQDAAEHEEFLGLYRHLIEAHHLSRVSRVQVASRSLEEIRALHARIDYAIPCGWTRGKNAPNVPIKEAESLAPRIDTKALVLAYLTDRVAVGGWASAGRVYRALDLVNRQQAEYLLESLVVDGLVDQSMSATSGSIKVYRAVANRPPVASPEEVVAVARERVLAHMRAKPEKEFILGWLRTTCDLGTVEEALTVLDGLINEGLVTKQGITNPISPTNTMTVYRLAEKGQSIQQHLAGHHKVDQHWLSQDDDEAETFHEALIYMGHECDRSNPDRGTSGKHRARRDYLLGSPDVEGHPFGYGLGGEPTRTLLTFGRRNGRTEATEKVFQEAVEHNVRLFGMAVEYLPDQPGVRMLIDPTKVVLHHGPIDVKAARELLEYLADPNGDFHGGWGSQAEYNPDKPIADTDVVARARKILGYRVKPHYPGDGTAELVREE